MIPATGNAKGDENRAYDGDLAGNTVEVDVQGASHSLRPEPFLTGFLSDDANTTSTDCYRDALVKMAQENGAATDSDDRGFKVPRPHTDANINDELIGAVIDGRFRIESRLSSGGIADVYLANQVDLRRTCVVKILRTEHIASEEFVATFNNESKLLAQIDCPQVVNVYGRGVFGPRCWIALEYLSGGDAAQWVEWRGLPSFALAAKWLRAALRGLNYLHEKIGVIHCDLKPNNLLIGGRHNLKIADLGLSRFRCANVHGGGGLIGTPLFMAPEQARGEATDERSDLFSLASSFFYILTGKASCHASTVSEARAMLAQGKYHCLGHDVPAGLRAVVNRLMQADPGDRYQTAAVALADLKSYLKRLSVAPRGILVRQIDGHDGRTAEVAKSTLLPRRHASVR